MDEEQKYTLVRFDPGLTLDPFGLLCQPQMLELAFTGLEAVGNFPQRPGLGELTEKHRHKLLPGSEASGVSLF